MTLTFRETPIGRIAIEGSGDWITRLFLPKNCPEDGNCQEPPLPVVEEAFRQLGLYLEGRLRDFSLALKPDGTPFMKRVWENVLEVPYGETRSYREIASSAGNPRAVRAVGMANARNPIPIFIPCHRIVGADGRLVGYGGGVELKARLLELEASHRP